MNFCTEVKKLINRYGSEIKVQRESFTQSTKGFIQPLRYKSKVYTDMSVSVGGFRDSRYYLYIGLPDVRFSRNDDAIILCNGKEYTVHTSETFDFSDRGLYVWAVLKPHKKGRQDDYDTN